MNRLIAIVFFTLLSVVPLAQAVNVSGATLDILAERTRIQSDRDGGESRFRQQEAACYSKFAVTDCLVEVRLQRRRLSDDLRRQTLSLNDMERRRKLLLKVNPNEIDSSSQKAN